MSTTRHSLIPLVAAAFLASAAHSLAAQTDRLPAPGDRIRIDRSSEPGHRLTGAVVRSDADSIGIATTEGEVVTIPGSSLGRYQVSRGMRSGFGRGLGVGALAGAVGGSLVGMGVANGDDFCNAACGLVGGALLFGGAGAIVGGIVGASSHYEKWETVDRSGPGVVVRPGKTAGVDLGLALRW